MYKSIYIPVKANKADIVYLFQTRRLSAEVWNLCVQLDKSNRKETGKSLTMSEIQKLTKKCVGLHAKGIHHVSHKYLFARDAMFRSRESGVERVRLPYKNKRYFNTGWDYQSIKIDYDKGIIFLARQSSIVDGKVKRNPRVKCYARTIPKNIVEIELTHKGKLMLCIKYKEEDYLEVKRENEASIDLGEIHAITSMCNNKNGVIITGRKIREIKHLRNNNLSVLRSKRSKCTKGSRQYRKYSRAIAKLQVKTDTRVNDCVHKVSKQYLDFCLTNNIGKVYYGDLDSATRSTKQNNKGNNHVRQKLSQWNYGELMRQVENKLTRHGIKLEKVKEYYTSQKCPQCKTLNKVHNREYKCSCGYKQHRDIVGAINILNDNGGYSIVRYETKLYLQIA